MTSCCLQCLQRQRIQRCQLWHDREIPGFSVNGESRGVKIAQRKRKPANSTCIPCISACEPLCAVLWKIAPGVYRPGGQTAVLGLCERLSVREAGQGDSCMDCTTVFKERVARPFVHPKPILMGTGRAKTASPKQRIELFLSGFSHHGL